MQERKFSSASDNGNKFSGLREADETTEDCQNYHKNYHKKSNKGAFL